MQQVTGAVFGENYFNLIEDASVVLDSEVPSRAIVVVKKRWSLQTVPFAHQVQRARYLARKRFE